MFCSKVTANLVVDKDLMDEVLVGLQFEWARLKETKNDLYPEGTVEQAAESSSDESIQPFTLGKKHSKGKRLLEQQESKRKRNRTEAGGEQLSASSLAPIGDDAAGGGEQLSASSADAAATEMDSDDEELVWRCYHCRHPIPDNHDWEHPGRCEKCGEESEYTIF